MRATTNTHSQRVSLEPASNGKAFAPLLLYSAADAAAELELELAASDGFDSSGLAVGDASSAPRLPGVKPTHEGTIATSSSAFAGLVTSTPLSSALTNVPRPLISAILCRSFHSNWLAFFIRRLCFRAS